jgi:hypothetical protein
MPCKIWKAAEASQRTFVSVPAIRTVSMSGRNGGVYQTIRARPSRNYLVAYWRNALGALIAVKAMYDPRNF